jgi:aspartyl/glutamyl-tRNA(Asn/Gln) amidotransferase C subunit
LEAVQRLRDDQVTEADQSGEFQTQAPDVSEGLYRVPKVIE